MLGFTSVITYIYNNKSTGLNYKDNEIIVKAMKSFEVIRSGESCDDYSAIFFNENNNADNRLRSESDSIAATKCAKRKKLSFCSTCRVILIPTRQEYVNAGIELWISDTLFHENKMAILIEVQEYLRRCPCKDKREAMKSILEDPLLLITRQ